MTFSVTPMNPESFSWNSETDEVNHLAALHCNGVYLTPWYGRGMRLEDQYDQDKAVLLCHGMGIPAPAPITMPDFDYNYSHALLVFRTNATTEDQYLLIFHVKGIHGPRAAFYINGNLVRSEEVDGDETIAILVDCPPPQTWTWVHMFCEDVGTGYIEYLELKEIECHIL